MNWRRVCEICTKNLGVISIISSRGKFWFCQYCINVSDKAETLADIALRERNKKGGDL